MYVAEGERELPACACWLRGQLGAPSLSTMAATPSGSRAAHARAILGAALHDRLPHTHVLLVGAGGIGCELRTFAHTSHTPRLTRCTVKNIVLAGFGHITLLDLDTIDLSNLNRQFLFKKKDVKQSKALVRAPSTYLPPPLLSPTVRTAPKQVAARTASAFNPAVHITPVHANIKDPQFDLPWFKSFDIVLNALDNLGTSTPPSLRSAASHRI